MVSLKRSLESEDRRLLVASYTRALRSTLESVRHYVIETDASSVEQFRKHIGQSLELVRSDDEVLSEEITSTLVANVRGELRDHRDRATCYIERMREDLAATAMALDEMLQAAQERGTEDRLQGEIVQLRSALSSQNLIEIRASVHRGLNAFSECAEQLRREKDAVIVQLKDEVRTLHKAAEQSRRAAAVDSTTGLNKPEECENVIRREIVADRAIGVIHVCMRNFHELSEAYAPAIIDQLLRAFCKRMGDVVPPKTVLTRWRGGVFLVLLPPQLATSVAAQLVGSCVGRYVCMDDGVARTLHVRATTTCVCSQRNEDPDEFLQKLNKLDCLT